nr:putative ubiquitin-conjugating enzyme E2 38 [Tanacetum cinerariifolium]
REESIVALDQNQDQDQDQDQDHRPRNVVAPMEGHVVEVLVKDGMRVKKGQLIVVLESMEYESPDDWADKIKKELNNLEQHLPEGIFVRACKERMELLRVVIIGQEETPYHHGDR